MSKKAVYPGTFDPITNGHIDLIKRAARIFEEVTVAVAYSKDKEPLFSVKERVEMLKKVTKGLKNVEVDSFDGLAVDYVIRKKANVIIRGLRMISDFEYEFQMALTNRKLRPEVETIFLMPHENYSYLSSKLIKEASSLGADVEKFVPDFIARELKKRLGKRKKK
ncbi:MAG: pantetheine-phosphate adenylyltransferase [Candidatus Omnitrophica bacterium]|nr:pantetheine-phosphate adenylyltransferase [Candidatus Omnitrophota bacterium]